MIRFFLILLFCFNSAWAFKFTPIYSTLAPEGKDSSQIFMLENDSQEKIPILISIKHRKVDVFGKEENAEAEDLFSVYPSQVILEKGEKKSVRVSWLGPKDIKKEEAFRIIAEQVPVQGLQSDDKKLKTSIKILIRYVGSLYIKPANTQPRLSVENFEIKNDPLGKIKKISLLFKNSGNEHILSNNPELTLHYSLPNKENKILVLKKDSDNDLLKAVDGLNVLAENQRQVEIPWPSALPANAVLNAIEIKPGK